VDINGIVELQINQRYVLNVKVLIGIKRELGILRDSS